MKKKLLNSMRVLLVAAGLCAGATSAWAYVVPDGYEIKTVHLGTNNGDGTVTAEDFSSVSAVSTAWSGDGLWLSSGETISIGEVEEVARPAVGSAVAEGTVPTYVSGKCIQVHDRTKNACHYADYSFDAVSSGVLVFSGDFWCTDKTYTHDIYFVDNEGNTVIRLLWNNGSGVRPFNYRYTASDDATEETTGATTNLCEYRKYAGWGVNEMSVDFGTGKVSLTIDYIDRDAKRQQTTVTFNIGTGRNIAKIKFGYGYWVNSTADNYWYLDNLKLYTIGAAAGNYNYTINAIAGETVIKQIASGKAISGSDFGAYIPEVIYYDGQYYRLSDENISSYYARFTMGDADAVKTVNYTLDTTIAAFWEGESMSAVGHSWYSNGNQSNNSECSNGATVCPYSSDNAVLNRGIKTPSTIAKGIYNITIKPYRWGNNATNYALQYSIDNVNWTDIETVSFASNSNDAYTADYILIPGDSYLRLMSPNGSTPRHSIDYVLVEKKADIVDASNEFVGKFDFTTEANAERSGDYTMTKGETLVLNFRNHGTTFGNNWRIEVKQGETWKSNTCADSWDYTADVATNVTSYKVSKDGGNTQVALDWDEYAADMDNANVVATLTYGWDGTLVIRTASTGGANGYIYYVDNDVTGLTGDLTINLSVCKSWLEILSAEASFVGIIAGSGYSSLALTDGVDFANATGLTAAYVITKITKDAVTLSPVAEVPAGTGVILKGSGAYSIPVKADASFSGTNLLNAAVEAYDCTANEVYILQGGAFHLVTAASTVPAGKAYLSASDVSANARSLNFEFGDETTGISTVSQEVLSGEFYNLQGQRVDAPKKGLYIVNGKKVIIK